MPAFRDWLAASRYRGSVTAFARANDVPRTTVQAWAGGGRVGPAYRERLRAITGLRFKPDRPGDSLDARARRIERLVRALARELAAFTGEEARPRELLRARIDVRTAHRVANLLLLFLDERRYAEYRDLNRALVRRR